MSQVKFYVGECTVDGSLSHVVCAHSAIERPLAVCIKTWEPIGSESVIV
jgi:hypothetical protein